MPLQSRRQRGLAIAFALALLTPGPRNNDKNEMDEEGCWLPSSWLSTSSFLIHVASAAAPTNEQQTSNNESLDETTLPRPLNYYEMLNLETPDTHRRKTGTLLGRKKRTTYRSKITTSDIKKAYRKQAQRFHPDKASRHNMTVALATEKFAEIAEAYQVLSDSVQRYDYDWELLEMEEEYEEERLLFEEEQRERKQQQRKQQQYEGGYDLYEKVRNGASNFLNLDPWAVFEDFFFQDSTAALNTDDYRYHEAQNPNSYNHQSYEGKQHHKSPQSRTPPRVSETTMYRGYDSSFGADVYTVLRREEYTDDVNDNGEYYYTLLGQDFISGTRVDPYTGFTMQEYYSAVTEPYFVEDGYSKQTSHGSRSNNYAGTNFNHKQQQHKSQTEAQTAQHRLSPFKLEEGESFTPNSTFNEERESDPWISPNGKYQAILTPTCELQVVSRDEQQKQNQSSSTMGDDDLANTIVWTSETYIPNIRAHGCYLTLNSMGSLVLSVDYGSGLGSIGNTVLWNTPLPPVVPHWFQEEDDNATQQPVTFRYYASVDDDGVIAVYRVGEKIGDGSDSRRKEENDSTRNNDIQTKLQIRPIIDKLGVMYHRISKSSIQQGQTKAALAWDQLRYKVGRVFVGRPWTATTDTEDQTDPNFSHECIYSTSPVGCLSSGRNVIHLTKKIARTLKRSVQSIDSHLDQFLSALTEPASDYEYDDYNYGYNSNTGYESNYPDLYDDDDEDVLDTLLRVTGAAGAQLGKAGMHGINAAQLGVNRGRKVAGKMVGKMKDRIGKHSTHWGERMAEKDEADIFF